MPDTGALTPTRPPLLRPPAIKPLKKNMEGKYKLFYTLFICHVDFKNPLKTPPNTLQKPPKNTPKYLPANHSLLENLVEASFQRWRS